MQVWSKFGYNHNFSAYAQVSAYYLCGAGTGIDWMRVKKLHPHSPLANSQNLMALFLLKTHTE